jgi:two-component system sensor histidine kinase HydH
MISTIIIIVFAFISADKITKPFSIMNRDLKNMNKKVNEMSEELKKSAIRAKNLESLAAMSAGLAHEIRNPLTSIKGYAQFIKSEIGSSSELKEDITVIIDEVDRLNKITERFLSFARPEKPDLSSNDINDIIIESVKAIKKEIDQNNINICMELNGVPKTMLDKEQMEQVIINIIINSVQAMGKDGNISISTSFIKEFNMVQVSISDTGGGIKKEDQDKVFEPFYTTKDKGTGLGLAICSRIIENHDGYIDFKSREGEGTVFLIKLPAIED